MQHYTILALLTCGLVAISAQPAVADDVLPAPQQYNATLLDAVRAPLMRTDLRILGAASCAAAACHGGAHPAVANASAARGAEYPLWLQNDPHARSWQTICSDASVAIMRRLGILRGDQIVDHAGFDNCLACHNTTHRGGNGPDQLREGVGCAACHGPEEHWIHEHYRTPWDPQMATEFGLVDNRNLLTRARVCAGCHVGDRDRDMNHDLIAAGHPELRYEFATYHARLPKHWREADGCDMPEAQLWLVGQLTSLDASLALLESRALSAPATGSWPEFAEYHCASCHHAMKAPGTGTIATGPSPEFSSWNRAGVTWLLNDIRDTGKQDPTDQALSTSLDRLTAQMHPLDAVHPGDVARHARDARYALDAWLQGPSGQRALRSFDASQLARIVDIADDSESASDSWERAVQAYLARVASRAAWPDGRNGATAQQLRIRQQELRYPSGKNTRE